MTISSPPRVSIWERSRSVVPGLAFVLATAAEYRRAAAASYRYEELKRMSRPRNDPAANASRQIYAEFYSDG
jgi:hypothetical protein